MNFGALIWPAAKAEFISVRNLVLTKNGGTRKVSYCSDPDF